jgi:hypothetical protein
MDRKMIKTFRQQQQPSNVGLRPDPGDECRHHVNIPSSSFQVNRIFSIRSVWQTEEQVEGVRCCRCCRGGVSARSWSRSRHLNYVDRSPSMLAALNSQGDGRVFLLAEWAVSNSGITIYNLCKQDRLFCTFSFYLYLCVPYQFLDKKIFSFEFS